jgi:hypothetical protein
VVRSLSTRSCSHRDVPSRLQGVGRSGSQPARPTGPAGWTSWTSSIFSIAFECRPLEPRSFVLGHSLASARCRPVPADPIRRDEYESFLPPSERHDRSISLAAARAWNKWEMSHGQLVPGANVYDKLDDDDWNLSHARFEAHYFAQRCFLEDGQLVRKENLDKM